MDAVDRRGHRASHDDPRVALAKALTGAALVPPRPARPTAAPLALLSIADRDNGLPATASRGALAGPATASPRRRRHAGRARGGRATTRGRSRKLGRGGRRGTARSRSSRLIASGEVRLVVNTPTPRSGAVRDAAEIRLRGDGEGILCLTAIETAVAAAEALDPAIAAALPEVRSLAEWVPESGRAAGPGELAPSRSRRAREAAGFDLVASTATGSSSDSERLSIRLDVGAARGAGLADDRGRDRRALRRPDGRRDAGEIEEHLGRDASAEWAAFAKHYLAAFAAELEPVDGVSRRGRARSRAPATRPAWPRAATTARSGGTSRRPGLLDRFGDRLFSGDDVVNGKPAPDLFLHARSGDGRRAGPDARSSRTAATGSRPHGRPGCGVFAYTSGVTPATALAGPADDAVRRHAVAAGADRGGRARRLSAGGRGRRLDHEGLPERPERQRRQGDHDHRQRHLPSAMLGCAAGPRRIRWPRTQWPAQRAEHVPADDALPGWTVQTKPGGSHA